MREEMQSEENRKPHQDIDDLIFGSAETVPSER